MSGILQPPLSGPAVVIRRPADDDARYVCSTWVRNLEPRDKSRWPALNRMVNAVLDLGTTRCLVACPPEDARRIAGWIVWGDLGRAKVLHYAYVRGGRDGLRGRGIGRALAARAGIEPPRRGADVRPLVYTFTGPDAAALLRRFAGVHMPIEQFLK